MKTIKRTEPIVRAERIYWDAYHYLQVCMADTHATLSDRRECLAEVKDAFDALVKLITKQYYAQHRVKLTKKHAEHLVSEMIADAIRMPANAQEQG